MTKNCLLCGEPFTPKRTDSKYCSTSCKNKYNYQLRTGHNKTEESSQPNTTTANIEPDTITPSSDNTINEQLKHIHELLEAARKEEKERYKAL